MDSGTTEPVTTETTETTEATSGGETEDETDALGNKYIYQNVDVNRKGICFNIVGEAQAKSVPLSNETRTFGIELNIYYENDNTPETHYQEFNSNTDKKQTVSLSVYPNDNSKVIDHVAFAFVYGYNKNSMTAYDAMLNIASTAASDESGTSSGEGEPSSTNGGENEPDDFIDYEVVSETLDTSQEYIDYNEDYTDAIRLKGNFINSLSYFSNLMDSIGNVKKLRFNPSISDKDYILLYYKMDDLILEGSDPINALSSSTHQRMYGSPTPLSKVIYFKYDILNLRYHLTENNCMQMMAKLLQLGRFSGSEFYDNVMRNVILCEMQGVFTPKFAYEQLNTIICYSDFGYTTKGLYIAHTSLLSACMLNSGVKIALNNYYTKLLYYILL